MDLTYFIMDELSCKKDKAQRLQRTFRTEADAALSVGVEQEQVARMLGALDEAREEAIASMPSREEMEDYQMAIDDDISMRYSARDHEMNDRLNPPSWMDEEQAAEYRAGC